MDVAELVDVQIAAARAAFERRGTAEQDALAVAVCFAEATPAEHLFDAREGLLASFVQVHLSAAVVQHQDARTKTELLRGFDHLQRLTRGGRASTALSTIGNLAVRASILSLGSIGFNTLTVISFGSTPSTLTCISIRPASFSARTFFSFSRYAFEIIITLWKDLLRA